MGPCYNCDKRTPTCHGTCEAYLLYRKKFDKIAKERRAQQRSQLFPKGRRQY